MIPFRVQIKYFLENPEAVDLSAFIALFQNWIQHHKLDEILIDVADYSHVFQGPGVLLIGHAGDFGLDMGEGRPGLLYTRKHQSGVSLPDQLRTSFGQALSACRLIEQEPGLKPRLKFRTDAVEVRFLDRLQLPNKPESLDLVREDVSAVLSEVYGVPFKIAPHSSDPRHVFALDVQVEQSPDIEKLLAHLQPAQ
jgi:hypothetical protein